MCLNNRETFFLSSPSIITRRLQTAADILLVINVDFSAWILPVTRWYFLSVSFFVFHRNNIHNFLTVTLCIHICIYNRGKSESNETRTLFCVYAERINVYSAVTSGILEKAIL